MRRGQGRLREDGKTEDRLKAGPTQPGSIPQNEVRFDMPPNLQQSTHSFRWEKGSASFLSVPGFFDPLANSPAIAIMQHTFNSGVPTHCAETLRFNLWLDRGLAPVNSEPVEVVIRKFEFSR